MIVILQQRRPNSLCIMERKGMDRRQKKKRGREGKDKTEQYSLEKSAKRQEDGHDDRDSNMIRLEDKPPSLHVFDFPWLKDGMISETWEEEWINIEDSFSSSLKEMEMKMEMERVEYLCEECLYESAATCAASLEKLEEMNGWDWGLDMESVDSIWNYFLNQPLEGGATA
ncbi:hypothetical protein HS088_TW09G00876 [Tripterygium wilfordii]|uniref:Uncharacterized protein n=1 Tax=Tripterygium wilfordii TaxID=458696 RepID=A0A7J7D9Q9_TRIWF|nr:uncharacterized protein LOC120006242 [Tripterygium wilfordii]KAF5742816.1 hypothetical protein HS088_TW09G00876 [Tripterygium wilfordii]